MNAIRHDEQSAWPLLSGPVARITVRAQGAPWVADLFLCVVGISGIVILFATAFDR